MALTDEARVVLERQHELRAVSRLVDRAMEGSGTTLVIEGGAGIGKTTLLSELCRAATRTGVAVARAAGVEVGGRRPLGVVTDLLEPLVASAPSTELFRGAAARTRPLFEGGGGERPLADHDTAAATVDAVRWLVASLAERGPLVLAVDDAQWLDALSARTLAALAANVDDLPLVLAFCVRTTDGSADSGPVADLRQVAGLCLQPAPLGLEAIEQLVTALLGAEPHPVFVSACAQSTRGNPLFLRALLDVLAADGVAPTSQAASAIAAAGDDAIGGYLERRLAGLQPDAHTVARALAMAEPDGHEALLAAVSGLAPRALAQCLDTMGQAGLVDRRRRGRPTLRHPLARRAILDRIPPAERRRGHVRIAHALRDRPARAAAHLAEADGPVGSRWAGEVLLSAGQDAARDGAVAEACELLEAALVEPLDVQGRRDTLVALGRALAHARDPRALDRLAEAAELAEDGPGAARVHLLRGQALFYSARLEESAAACREARRRLDGADRDLELRLEAEALNAERLRGSAAGEPPVPEAVPIAARTPGERCMAVHVAGAAAAAGQLPAGDVAAVARAAWSGGRLLDDVGSGSPLLPFCGTALAWAEDWAGALELTSRTLERARAEGSAAAAAYALSLRAGVRMRMGDLRSAEDDALLVVDVERPADPIASMSALSFLIEALIDRGDLDQARARLDASGLTGPLPALGTVDFLCLARARLAEAEGDDGAALAEYLEVGERADRTGTVNPAGPAWRSRAACVLVRAGEPDRALELARDDVARARRFGAPRALGIALIALAAVDDGEERVRRLDDAVATLRDSRATVEYARALLGLGRALLATDRLEPARTHLAEAMDTAHHAGATALVDGALDGLRATGARPRRPAVSGLDALTSQQRRIAAMAADGQSNREIAEALVLTLRTVESHLTAAYAKLGVHGRAGLGGVRGLRPLG